MSMILFNIVQLGHNFMQIQDKASKATNTTVLKLSNKIDKVETQLISIINAQGNFTSKQRASLTSELVDMLNDFKAIESQGGFATKSGQSDNNHVLTEILGNVTQNKTP